MAYTKFEKINIPYDNKSEGDVINSAEWNENFLEIENITNKNAEAFNTAFDEAGILTVPTKTSDLTNDSGFITLADIPEGGVTSYNDLTDKPTIPSKTSQLENDSGYLTEHQSLSAYALKTEIPEVPTKTSDLTNDNNYITIDDVPNDAVSSINGKTGVVVLSANDVGALPSNTEIPTVPTNISSFTNDAGYLTEHQSLSAYAKTVDLPTKTSDLTNDSGFITIDDVPSGTSSGVTSGVTSVNSKTGAVVLDAEDVGALPTTGGTATGKIIVTANSAAGFESIRTVSGQQKCAGFFVNSDGTSKFVNKNGENDAAALLFDNTGVYYAIGPNGSKTTGKLMATQEYVNNNIPEVPTKTSELTNDSTFKTQTEIQAMIDAKFDSIIDGDEVSY